MRRVTCSQGRGDALHVEGWGFHMPEPQAGGTVCGFKLPSHVPISSTPGGNGLITDVCVPLSRLTECVLEAQRLCKAHGLLAPLVGHVGDSK